MCAPCDFQLINICNMGDLYLSEAFGSLKKFIFNQMKLPRRLTENKLIDYTVHPVI